MAHMVTQSVALKCSSSGSPGLQVSHRLSVKPQPTVAETFGSCVRSVGPNNFEFWPRSDLHVNRMRSDFANFFGTHCARYLLLTLLGMARPTANFNILQSLSSFSRVHRPRLLRKRRCIACHWWCRRTCLRVRDGQGSFLWRWLWRGDVTGSIA